jgi:hypothetical protein
MTSARRFTALALARAMLAGPRTAPGVAARMQACLGAAAPWCTPMVERCAAMPGERWRRLTVQSLATWIEQDTHYEDGWRAHDKPFARRYILREATVMQPLPVGLEHAQVPYWPHVGALAEGHPAPVRARWPTAAEPRRPSGLAGPPAGARGVGHATEPGEGPAAEAGVRPHRLGGLERYTPSAPGGPRSGRTRQTWGPSVHLRHPHAESLRFVTSR